MTYYERMLQFCGGNQSFANNTLEVLLFLSLAFLTEKGDLLRPWHNASDDERAVIIGELLKEMHGKLNDVPYDNFFPVLLKHLQEKGLIEPHKEFKGLQYDALVERISTYARSSNYLY